MLAVLAVLAPALLLLGGCKLEPALAEGNRLYEERFGRIFLVCATGKSAEQMLAILDERLSHDAETELRIASEEQAKITRLRLEKLIGEPA